MKRAVRTQRGKDNVRGEHNATRETGGEEPHAPAVSKYFLEEEKPSWVLKVVGVIQVEDQGKGLPGRGKGFGEGVKEPRSTMMSSGNCEMFGVAGAQG